ncbi:MAG: S41 family peptidase [Lachnospiraceae bacterium]|nr:S41 family peptidase [Lachnospiraceae bacterium]
MEDNKNQSKSQPENITGYQHMNGYNEFNNGNYAQRNVMNYSQMYNPQNNNGYSQNNQTFNNDMPGTGNSNKKSRSGLSINILLFIIAFAAIIMAIVVKISADKNSSDKSIDDVNNVDEITDKAEYILELLDKYYYNVDDNYKEKIADGIYQGIIDTLDDNYADYYDAEEWKAVLESDQGVYCGIGVAVQQDENTGEIIAVNPYEYAPAYKAGLRVEDRIIAIDDIDIRGMSIDEAVSLIRGEEGTTVKLTVRRNTEILDFVVTREQIETQTVVTKVLEDNIGYLQITSFDGVTYNQFINGLDELLNQGIKGIIFDVRSNGGGYYDTVVNMLDRILPEGKIVYMEDKNGRQDVEYSDAECLDLPMCVLVNGYTASASEIFSGAIQDYELGAIIGEQTFGKGIVQNTYTFRDGSAVKFTIAGYFTPNGRDIHGKGITPDIVVSLPTDREAYNENGVIKDGMDTQLNEGIKYIKEQIK